MKQFVCLICACCSFISGIAQIPSLAIATDKTISLVFPFSIRHVDRGTKDVLVQQIKEADNILLVKAASQHFRETNLSVVTNDGSVYTFRVTYDLNPPVWVVTIPQHNKSALSTYANSILNNQPIIHGIHDKSWDIIARLSGIYIKEKVIYYQMVLENQSSIDYDIELLRFFIRDKKKGKRTAVQENELKPLYIAGNIGLVKSNSRNGIVVAFDKFTIPDAKYFAVQIMEKNGGRHLLLRVHNNKIIKAIPLSDLQ